MFTRVVLPVFMCLLITASTWADSLHPQQLAHRLDLCIDSFFTAGKAVNRDTSITLSKQCPAIPAEAAHPALSNLQPPLEDETTLAQLQDIRAVLAFLQTKPATQAAFDYADLKGVLSDTYIEKKEFIAQTSLWDHFLDWLKEIFKAEDAEPPEWLVDFIESIRIPEGVATAIAEVSMLVLVIMAILIIFNELRAANLVAAWRHRRHKKRMQTMHSYSSSGTALSLEQISELQGRKLSSALLYYVLVHLMNKGLLPEKFNLTNRELAEQTGNFRVEPDGQAGLPDLAELFKRFMGLSDINLYAREEPDTEEQRQALTLARQIKEQSESA